MWVVPIVNLILLIYRHKDEKAVEKSEEFLKKLIQKHLAVNHCLVQELRWGLLTKYEQNKRYHLLHLI